jgi:hypothetical protein
MRNPRYYLKLIILFLFVSCNVRPFVTLADYQDTIENKTLLITPLQKASISARQQINEVFGNEESYISFFQEKFENILRHVSTFSEIHTAALKTSADLKAIEFILPGNDTTYFYLPIGKTNISDTSGITTDFVLFFSEPEVALSWIDVEYKEKPDIRHTLYYLFWDNHLGKVVCYGKANFTDGAQEKNQHTFQLWINSLVKLFVEETPFRKHRNQW